MQCAWPANACFAWSILRVVHHPHNIIGTINSTVDYITRGESNCPDVTISVYGSSCNYLFFSFYIYFLASHAVLGMLLNIERKKQRSKIEAEKDIITVHELPYSQVVKSGTIRLASDYIICPVLSGKNKLERLNRFCAEPLLFSKWFWKTTLII